MRVQGRRVVLDGTASSPAKPDAARLTRYEWTAEHRRLANGDGSTLRLRIPRKDGEYSITLEVSDAEGRSASSTTYFAVEDGEARAVDLQHEHADWVDRAVVYAPVPALWGTGGPKSVQQRLPYLARLGVNTLWLWPPTSRRARGEEYAVTDYFELDPSWGPKQALKNLIDEAHDLGMRVLIDFVPNHMAARGPYFKDAARYGRASPYWDFFDRKANGKATHYFDWKHLPNLNYDNREVRNMIVEASAFWVRAFDVDGFRMDVPWGVRRRRPGFWPRWRAELKRIDSGLLLLAEATAVDPYYFRKGFDVAYDWTEELGHWSWAEAFESRARTGALLERALTNDGKGYARDALILRFLNNNDTGDRFVDRYGPELTKVAATLQFTVPGVPALFAGDEIGASYEPYSELDAIPWRDRYGLRPLYRQLIRLRQDLPALTSPDLSMLPTDSDNSLAYLRPAGEGERPVLVVLNFGGEAIVRFSSDRRSAQVPGPGDALRDPLTGAELTLAGRDGALTLPMAARSARVLVPTRTD